MYLHISACEQCRKVAAQQERIRAGQIYVVLFFRVQAVDCNLEIFTKLHLVDQKIIVDPFSIICFDVIIEGMIILQMFKLYLGQIYAYDVGRYISIADIFREGTQQF